MLKSDTSNFTPPVTPTALADVSIPAARFTVCHSPPAHIITLLFPLIVGLTVISASTRGMAVRGKLGLTNPVGTALGWNRPIENCAWFFAGELYVTWALKFG